eukprot:10763333-Karenia_brevis.AAC.1
MAAKLRVIEKVAPDCAKKVHDLECCHISQRRRPFGEWHQQSYFQILHTLEAELSRHGITRALIRRTCCTPGNVSFQFVAERIIRERLGQPYYPESRLRHKLVGWRLRGVPGIIERRILRAFQLLRSRCPPRVMAIYLRTIWNGWVTDRRMKNLNNS